MRCAPINCGVARSAYPSLQILYGVQPSRDTANFMHVLAGSSTETQSGYNLQ